MPELQDLCILVVLCILIAAEIEHDLRHYFLFILQAVLCMFLEDCILFCAQ